MNRGHCSLGCQSSTLTKIKEAASRTKQDKTMQTILVNVNNKQEICWEDWAVYRTHQSKCCTAVLGSKWDWLLRVFGWCSIWYCTIGWFQIVIVSSRSALSSLRRLVLSVKRVSSVSVTILQSMVLFFLWYALKK